jgi:hypothetical protein
MKKIIPTLLVLSGLGIFSFAFAQSDIHISQIQITGGKNNTDNDFIEFFNASSSSVNLKGCHLVKRPGNANSDTLVKSWSKDTFIPAKSFYLWANSGFVNTAVKPDVVSSATISDNTGVALRFGAVNSGVILDSASWGKTANGFNNVSSVNPGAGQALIRTDLYQDQSTYFIGASNPRDSLINDLTAAFDASQETDRVIKSDNKITAGQAKIASISADTSLATQTPPDAGQVEGEDMIAATPSADNQNSQPAYSGQSYQTSQSAKKGAVKYLILSGAALAILLIIAKKYLFNKRK